MAVRWTSWLLTLFIQMCENASTTVVIRHTTIITTPTSSTQQQPSTKPFDCIPLIPAPQHIMQSKVALSNLGASAVRQREESTSHAAKEEEEIGDMPGMQKAQVHEATPVQRVQQVQGAPPLPTRSVLRPRTGDVLAVRNRSTNMCSGTRASRAHQGILWVQNCQTCARLFRIGRKIRGGICGILK